METKWTEAQQNVINIRNKNVLVSAAAGSGKTAVLVERIINRITDPAHPVDVDKLLVVTFTNAAASEMRERILLAMEKLVENKPDDEHLQKQLTYIHNANISTIHSFCLNVIRNNFSILDIDPGFSIGDNGELELMKSDMIKKVIENYYQNKSEEFIDFVEQYSSGRSDSKIEEMILKLYGFSRSYPEPDKWLDLCSGQYDVQGIEDLEKSEWMKVLMDDIHMRINRMSGKIKKCLEICMEEDGPGAYEEAIQSDVNYMDALESKTTFSEIGHCIRAYDAAALSRKKDDGVSPEKKEQVKNMRELFKKDIARMKKDYFLTDLDEQVKCMKECHRTMKVLVKLTKDFAEMYSQCKKEKNLVDFNDLEHFALAVLVEKNPEGQFVPTAIAREMSEQFEEIMIDEYQDSNYVQELLLTSVSGEKYGKNNMFMVGDVKQSIYKFRLARPELFIRKYQEYANLKSLKDDELLPGNNRKIVLDRNFRSRQEVLSATNLVFGHIMGKRLGGIEYDDENALYPGAHFAERSSEQNDEAELIIVRAEDDGEESLNVSDKDTKELEAYAVAKRINELVDNYMVFDKNSRQYRKCRFSDIAILMRSVTGNADIYSEVLEKEGIPAYCETDTGYFDAMEVTTVLNMLRIIDNPRQDIPLVSVLTSPMFGVSNELLASVKGENMDENYFDAVRNYCEAHEDEISLNRFLVLLTKYREMSVYTSIYNIITVILEDTGYYHYITALPGGKRRRANIDMLKEKALTYEKGSYKGLFNFVRYIEKINKYQIDYGEASVVSEGDNTVRIMTIHKSKGLEFPVVFVSAMGRKMNKMDTRDKMVIHSDMGVGIDCILKDERLKINTLIKKAICRKIELDNLGEELRVLYVAFTRAKEKLILTGTIKNMENADRKWQEAIYEEEEKLSPEILSLADTYLDLVEFALKKNGDRCPVISRKIVEINDLISSKVEDMVTAEITRKNLENFDCTRIYDENIHSQVDKLINYRYPFENVKIIPSKLSVSELKHRDMEETGYDVIADEHTKEQEICVPRFISGEKELTGAARGTAFHRILELMDYSVAPTEENMRNMVQSFLKAGKIDESIYQVTEYDKLLKFRKSDIGKRMESAYCQGVLTREGKFVMGVNADRIDESYPEDETILVQGIIDAWFIEDDEAVIVDYKTDRVHDINELADRYAAQLHYYALAIEKLTGYHVKEKIIYSLHFSKELVL